MTGVSDVREVLYVQDKQALNTLCEALRGSEWLALDTEFLREKTYFPKLCLLQIASESLIACVDPLAIDDLTPLFEVIYDTSITKILHSARQDYEILFYLMGRLPEPVFDTQVAASLCSGLEQIGYAALVQQVVGVDLEKGCTRTDWSQRPLAAAQLRYAEDDVRYLGELFHQQSRVLRERGLLSWLSEECVSLISPETYEIVPEKTWLRIKESRRLKPAQLVVLKSLAAWREQQAVERDKPRKWVVRDDTLAELAVKKPQNELELSKIQGLSDGLVARHGKELLSLIDEAQKIPEEHWPCLPHRQKRSADEQVQIEVMMALIAKYADEYGVALPVFGGKKDLEALLNSHENNRLLQGWRYEVFGKILLAFLQGETKLTLVDGELVIEQA